MVDAFARVCRHRPRRIPGCSKSSACFDSLTGRRAPSARLGGDIPGNGLSKLFLTIAAGFAEAERDRIRERIGQSKLEMDLIDRTVRFEGKPVELVPREFKLISRLNRPPNAGL
jgi:DNA-binding response OmpR family regulator